MFETRQWMMAKFDDDATLLSDRTSNLGLVASSRRNDRYLMDINQLVYCRQREMWSELRLYCTAML